MAVMASLREKVAEKSAEIDILHQKMSSLAKEHEADVSRVDRCESAPDLSVGSTDS